MSGWIAVGGWVAGAAGTLAAVHSRRRLVARMELVARACHEVRGPLAAARLGLSWGQRNDGLSRSRLHALEQELERAGLAVDDLENARRGSAAVPLQWRALEVADLVSASVAAWEASAATRCTRIKQVWSGPHVQIEGDRVRLAQALGNLIANALEHGRGPVEVRAGSDSDVARVEVQDSGPGLDAPIAELAGRRSSSARGHGLAVAASIVAAHGGRLSSAPSSAGARLVMTLPLVGAQRQPTASRS